MELQSNDRCQVTRGDKEVTIKVADLKATDVLTVAAFKNEIGCPDMVSAKIHYHLDNTDKLDFTMINGYKMIIRNSKVKDFTSVISEHGDGKKNRIARMNLNS